MIDSLQSILGSRVPQEPPEVAVIKRFVRDEFKADCGVTVQPTQLMIRVPSAALAGALRMRLHELKQLCQTEKRLVIRIA